MGLWIVDGNSLRLTESATNLAANLAALTVARMLLRHWTREDAIGDASPHQPTWLVNLLHSFPHFDAKLQQVRERVTFISQGFAFLNHTKNWIYDYLLSFNSPISLFRSRFAIKVDSAFSPTIAYGESLVVLSAIPVIWLLLTLLLFLIFFCVRCCQACLKSRLATHFYSIMSN